MKRPQELPYWISLFIALALLMLAAGMARAWIYGPFLLAIALFDWLARRFRWGWCPTLLLLAYVALAAFAVFSDISPALVIAGVAAALFHWEVSDSPTGDPNTDETPLAVQFERQRLRCLGLSTALGLALAELGLFLRVDLAFSGAILAAVVLLFSLYRLFFSSPARRQHPEK